MAEDPKLNEPEETASLDNGFVKRWSRRKSVADGTAAERGGTSNDDTAVSIPLESDVSAPDVLADADLPPVNALHEDSDVSGFLSRGVSGRLRKLALNKLFHLPKFNVTDGLDDYDDNFRDFAPLGDIVTADMRHQMERAAEKARQALLDGEQKKVAPKVGKQTEPDKHESARDETASVQGDDKSQSETPEGTA